MSLITVQRYHDFSYGHRVYGHENVCAHLHGHNGRVHFYCWAPNLDEQGRVIDFGVLKTRLCDWIEKEWDHRFLLWNKDPWFNALSELDPNVLGLPFNPTAENLAQYLLSTIGPELLVGTEVMLHKVHFEETRKCSAWAVR